MQANWLILMTLLAGALMPLQAGINGQLAAQLSSTLAAALISFVVGTLLLLVLVWVAREFPSLSSLRALQPWHWIGGLLGAFFIGTAALAGPRLGALLFMTLILAGQLSMAMLLDHQGWVGFREAPISWGKIGGLLLIVAGVMLIRRG